jgi:hypothetical protein
LLETYGALKRLSLRPESGSASIEFDSAVAAGKAALALEGYELFGQPIHFVDNIRQANKQSSTMFKPRVVRKK